MLKAVEISVIVAGGLPLATYVVYVVVTVEISPETGASAGLLLTTVRVSVMTEPLANWVTVETAVLPPIVMVRGGGMVPFWYTVAVEIKVEIRVDAGSVVVP